MATGYLLTEADREWVRTLIKDYLDRLGNPAQRPATELDYQVGAPEVYLAFTSPGGIPALNQEGTTGTGTGAAKDDVPGWAMCEIWRLEAISGTVMPIGALTARVWNFNTIAIPAGMWVTILRDKHGNWLVPCPGFQFGTCTTSGSGVGGLSGTIGGPALAAPPTGTGGIGPGGGAGLI